ncbi:hypothetical protein FRIG_04830 [Frigoribacterium faeni]|uniref:glycosyltransferase n=1 Tax=Frigoribacterium faeni TaxID=145483 RepID=UPI001FACF89D|nr:glycosyltransferase [Frigoribacterium faeni]MCJ0700461.1 hypothetical protein [Frigoribacterium faeni]
MTRRLTVLMSPGETVENDNPFVELLISHLPDDIVVKPFRWKSAFLSRYDVLHIHWPEHILTAGSPMKRRVKSILFLGLVARNRFLASNLRTVHNLRPHEEAPFLTRMALASWQRSCRASAFLSMAGRSAEQSSAAHGTTVVIPHGDYRPLVRRLERPVREKIPGRLLAFGYLRPYKGLEQLISAFRATAPERGLTLRITGAPVPKSYGDDLLSLAADDDRISIELGRQADDALVDEIMKASLVALPYKQVYNSGAALLALTLDRPLVVTDSPTMRELGDEVGENWVTRLTDWDSESLESAIQVDVAPDSSPDLDGRDWSSLSKQYAELYRSLRRRRGAVRGRPKTDDRSP